MKTPLQLCGRVCALFDPVTVNADLPRNTIAYQVDLALISFEQNWFPKQDNGADQLRLMVPEACACWTGPGCEVREERRDLPRHSMGIHGTGIYAYIHP